MLPFRMARVSQALGGEIVGEGHVVRGGLAPFVDSFTREAGAGGGHVLVDGPTKGAVIDDHPMGCDGTEGIWIPPASLRLTIDANAHPQMANDHIVAANVDAATDEGDAGRGGGLSGYREVGLADFEHRAAEIDHAAHIKYHDARPAGFDGLLERARAGRVEVGHADNFSALAA